MKIPCLFFLMRFACCNSTLHSAMFFVASWILFSVKNKHNYQKWEKKKKKSTIKHFVFKRDKKRAKWTHCTKEINKQDLEKPEGIRRASMNRLNNRMIKIAHLQWQVIQIKAVYGTPPHPHPPLILLLRVLKICLEKVEDTCSYF